MLKHKKSLILSTLLLLLPMLAGLVLWNRLPDQLPIHWNAAGEIDGWSSKAVGVFGLPGLILVIHWICILGTHADPKRRNQSGKLKQLLIWFCPVLSVLLSVVTLGTAMGGYFPIERILPVFVGVLFVIIGNYLPKCRQNYAIGIRLSWALDSEENWNATHRIAGFVSVIGGVLLLLSVFLPVGWIVGMFLAVLLAVILVPTVYSYCYYRKHR